MRHQFSAVSLVYISYFRSIGIHIILIILILSQFTPICVSKNLSNAPAQILNQLRHFLLLDTFSYKSLIVISHKSNFYKKETKCLIVKTCGLLSYSSRVQCITLILTCI